MINNDVIRSVRHMLDVSETKLVEIASLGGAKVDLEDMKAYVKKEEVPGFRECPQKLMGQFLNGLIYLLRGKDESRPPLPNEPPTNNVVMKKLRVAFKLRDDDIIAFLDQSGFKVSKGEVSAFFRKEGHPNYRVCGDQFLRNFLKGLTAKVRAL